MNSTPPAICRIAAQIAKTPTDPVSGSHRAKSWHNYCLGFIAAWLVPLALHATENGTTTFPNGGEDFLVAAMPPPGMYGWLTFNRYDADRLADNSGQMSLQSFNLGVNALVPRFDWVKPVSVLGADRWGTLFILPLLDLDMALSPAPGVVIRGRKRGLSDFVIGNGLHWTFPNFHMVNALDAVIPTGAYDAADLVNPGQNHWVIRLNHMGTWSPTPVWDVSYRLHWDYNFKNPDTGYRSGQTLYLNWAVGWKPEPPLTLGVAGYFLRQITDDHAGAAVVIPGGNRVRVDGIGPCVKYFLPNHVMFTAKYFHEFDACNHPQGNQFWVYVVTPLGPPQH